MKQIFKKYNKNIQRKNFYPFICILSLLLLSGCGITSIPVKLESTTHIIEKNQEKEELFISANIWLVESFKSAKDVIQFSDKEAGIVMGKYMLQPPYYIGDSSNPNPNGVTALIKIQTKDGATRITVVPEAFREFESAMRPDLSYTREIAQQQINRLIQSYTSFVRYDQSNDW